MKPTKEQKEIFHAIEHTNKNLIIEARAGCGKCLGIDTPILMYDGTIKLVQDIEVGDQLMGDDSKPRNVLNTNKGNGDLYRIIPQKGDSWVCNDVHILTLFDTKQRKLVDLPINDLKNKTTLSGYFIGVKLQRNDLKANQIIRTRFKLEYIGKGDYYGFTLDGNGRFLLGDFTITHNTSTIVMATKLIPKDSKKIFMAYNKHIQMDLKNKLPEDMYCRTFHGFGVASILRTYPSIKFDNHKVDKIIRKLSKNWDLNISNSYETDLYLNRIKKICDLCRLTITLDKKYLQYLINKHDIGLNEVDHPKILKVLEVLTNDRTTYDYVDMIFLPAIDNRIWLFQYDYVFVDEIQDLNRAQQFMLTKMLRKKNKKQIGRIVGIGDEKQCQPEGTKVLMSDGTEKNIEDVEIGDKVVSYESRNSCRFYGFHKYKKGVNTPEILNVSKRLVNEDLVIVKAGDKISKYTKNHRCFVKFRKDKTKAHVLYLMEKNGKYRIGIAPLWSKSGNNSVSTRAKQEKANKFWILSIYEKKFNCYLDEQYYSLKYSIPQLRFHDNKTGLFNQEIIDKFYSRFDLDKLKNNAIMLLDEHKKSHDHPFWERETKNYISKHALFEVNACNIFNKYMSVAIFDEKNKYNRTHGKTGMVDKFLKPKIINIENVSYEYYHGYVYSLKVSRFETYVADGILTHNSIYGFTGVSEKSFDWFRNLKNLKILSLTHTFRCGREIVKLAQQLVPDIKAADTVSNGIVRDGSVLDEPDDGDFVLCRINAPLIKLFFHYLKQGKKAVIKGQDIGISMIDMIKDHKSIAQLKAHWANELKDSEIKLRKQGVLNFRENSSYTSLEDKVNTISFIADMSSNIPNMIDKIKKIYTDDLEGIVLSSVHKAKGLEATRVFIARPDKMPLGSNQAWQYEQEKNLMYVAYTRAIDELVFDREWNDEKDE